MRSNGSCFGEGSTHGATPRRECAAPSVRSGGALPGAPLGCGLRVGSLLAGIPTRTHYGRWERARIESAHSRRRIRRSAGQYLAPIVGRYLRAPTAHSCDRARCRASVSAESPLDRYSGTHAGGTAPRPGRHLRRRSPRISLPSASEGSFASRRAERDERLRRAPSLRYLDGDASARRSPARRCRRRASRVALSRSLRRGSRGARRRNAPVYRRRNAARSEIRGDPRSRETVTRELGKNKSPRPSRSLDTGGGRRTKERGRRPITD